MMDLQYFKPSEAFLDEEEICGFNVTSGRKSIWAVELDLLMAFQSVCDKYNLKYWMFGGSLLGTARHEGFIPWDDDIDLIMPRKDYDILLEIGPEEFAYPYAFETPVTEKKEWFSTYCKLRNRRTSGMIETENPVDNNHGLWIDIFAIDDTVTWLAPLHYFISGGPRLLSKMHLLNNALFFKLWNWHEKIFMNMNCDGYMQGAGPTSYRIYHGRHFWEGTVYRYFCGLKVPVPEHYEEILSLCYGDWKEFNYKKEHFKIKNEKGIGSWGI